MKALSNILKAIALSLIAASPVSASEQRCTFSDWAWHSESGQAVDYREVVTTRDALTPKQVHPNLDCSVCREDQVEVGLTDGPKVLVCKVIADDVQAALDDAVRAGFPVSTLTGYRVGRTKGPLDEDGLRTAYSHHSFGVAIDVNAEVNGLYDRCIRFSPRCRLRRGGLWRPGQEGSIMPGDPLYEAMTESGLKWGGELAGRQKDFMHFSLTGD